MGPLIAAVGRLLAGGARVAARSGRGVARLAGKAVRGSLAAGLERKGGVAGRWLAGKIEPRPSSLRLLRGLPTARILGLSPRIARAGAAGSSHGLLEAIESLKKRVESSIEDLAKTAETSGRTAIDSVVEGGKSVEAALRRVSALIDDGEESDREAALEAGDSRDGPGEKPTLEDTERSMIDSVVSGLARTGVGIAKASVPATAAALVAGTVMGGRARASELDPTDDEHEDEEPLRRLKFKARKIVFDADDIVHPGMLDRRAGGSGGTSGDEVIPIGRSSPTDGPDYPTDGGDERPSYSPGEYRPSGEEVSPDDARPSEPDGPRDGGQPGVEPAPEYDEEESEAPPPLEGKEDVRQFWNERNERAGARLYDSKGEALVDERLLSAGADGIRAFEKANPGYRVETYGPSGGLRHSGSTANHGRQKGLAALTGERGGAMDIVIIDKKTGRMLTNHPGAKHRNQGTVGENAPKYQELFNNVVRAGERRSPGFRKDARSGAYFSGGDNAMDLMHWDVRGQVAPQGGGSVDNGFTRKQMKRFGIRENVGFDDFAPKKTRIARPSIDEPSETVEKVRPAPKKRFEHSGDETSYRSALDEGRADRSPVQRRTGVLDEEPSVRRAGLTFNQYLGLENEEVE